MTEREQDLAQDPATDASTDENDVEAHKKPGLGGGATMPVEPPADE